jgi:predicted RNA-binding Zn-ribbon protein involved in translation (DUF1610 family)
LNGRNERDFRVLYRRVIKLGRWFLLMVCLGAGLFVLLSGKSKGFGILFLLAALWLILDNPLENFTTLVGFCPSCSQEIRIRRRNKFNCPLCEETVILEASTSDPQDDSLVAKLQASAGEEILADFSQTEALVVGLGDTLDLHTFQPKDLPSLLDEFIRVSQRDGILLVKIVHGKGTGALRRRVRGLLAQDPRVANFYNAPPKSGDWGATVVELKALQEGEDDKVTSKNQKWLTN